MVPCAGIKKSSMTFSDIMNIEQMGWGKFSIHAFKAKKSGHVIVLLWLETFLFFNDKNLMFRTAWQEVIFNLDFPHFV